MVKKTTKKLVDQLMSDDDHIFEEKSFRKSAWHKNINATTSQFDCFIKSYMNGLKNNHVLERVNFLENKLLKKGYRNIENISGENLETIIISENHRKLSPGQRFYVKLEETTVVAVQIGKKPIEHGVNIAGAHLDSPCITASLQKFKENYNLAYIRCNMKGGIDPKDFRNIPLYMHVEAVVTNKRGNREKRNIIIGKDDKEPKVMIPEISYHLSDDSESNFNNLDVLVGNKPYKDSSFDFDKQITLEILRRLNKKYDIVQEDLVSANISFFPTHKAESIGLDGGSMILGPGQDNFACVYALLSSFLDVKNPTYTKIAVFYDNEEIGDTGRGSLSRNLLQELVFPSLISLVKKDGSDQWKMLRNTWSIYADILEPIHGYEPANHDKSDSSYMGSGVVITPFSGDSMKMSGYESTVEIRDAFVQLFKKNNLSYQFGLMGTKENLIGGNSNLFHQQLAQGIDIGIPLIGAHRQNELISKIDIWNLYNTFNGFYSVKDHDKYIPKFKK